jgi:glyoxylase-like metal-dependent hydrolase (beta-lactamase superfamily II)
MIRARRFPKTATVAMSAAVLTALALAANAPAALAKLAPPVSLWRLDCGRFVEKGLVDSCYLVRHGDTYLLWDAGVGADLAGQGPRRIENNLVALDAALAPQLAAIGVRPEQVAILALSHAHFDHVGQAADFPHATLMLGREDWDDLVVAANLASRSALPPDLAGRRPPSAYSLARLAPWLGGRGRADPVDGDRDLFGDGRVVMIAAPGHSPGHHVLLVRLKHGGSILLTGDLWATERQRRDGTVSAHNPDPAATRSSHAKVERLARRLGARIVIGHDPGDVASLPAFPAAAD